MKHQKNRMKEEKNMDKSNLEKIKIVAIVSKTIDLHKLD